MIISNSNQFLPCVILINKRLCLCVTLGHFIIDQPFSDTDLYIQIAPARAVALIYMFKYPQPG